MDKKWVYEFSVWPAEKTFNKAVFELFRHLNTRIAMEFTENEFNIFRDSLNCHGLTLRDIGRVPYHKPESVL